jgi:hypothetical protein
LIRDDNASDIAADNAADNTASKKAGKAANFHRTIADMAKKPSPAEAVLTRFRPFGRSLINDPK